ncbi:MAG: hypothetical protein JSV52_02960 [Candidatus Zixiibacteriota bacterium]|nr:MAG: hypothetical protein JSV52_02960 [candidate division Zixibacteria bacterium]
MKQMISLKEIERRAYRSTFQDGIYDILFGMIFLILAWIPALDKVNIPRTYGYLLILLPVLMVWIGKRQITIPRLGAVEFGPTRRTRKMLFLIVVAAFFFLNMPLLLMMGDGFGGGLLEHAGIPVAAGLVVTPVIVVAGYFLDCPRMFVYAALMAFSIPQSSFMYDFVGWPFNSVISLGIPGLVILIYGLTLLSGFLTKYPRLKAEVNHVGQ